MEMIYVFAVFAFLGVSIMGVGFFGIKALNYLIENNSSVRSCDDMWERNYKLERKVDKLREKLEQIEEEDETTNVAAT